MSNFTILFACNVACTANCIYLFFFIRRSSDSMFEAKNDKDLEV